jgi:hypothetical protein
MIDDNYFDDPKLGDEEDPEYREEMFRTYRFMGTRPEQLHDPAFAAEYAEWLKTAPPEEEEDD